jgi:EF hand
MKNLTMLLAGLFISGIVQAEGFMPWTKVATMADLNDDGMITMFEVERFKPVSDFPGFQPFMADHFQDLDTNDDGMIDSNELAQAKEMFKMTDTEISQAFFKRQGFMPRS